MQSDTTPDQQGNSPVDSDFSLEHPERVGPYKILQILGEGGMGVVYDAEQTKPVRRRVALKVVKLGMDTKEIVARFEAERQALAVMDHPNIAKVLDAGATSEGRLYFVMEHVPGMSLTEYCDSRQLPTRERLELFVSICRAVQHAHQKGVIHRDLKPSNVLVMEQEGKPVPKIIDFGIAKAISRPLTEMTLVTQYGQAMGTPAYMSPEQAEMSGLDVDTRTDIYSLGVMLYELLVGRVPLEPTDVGFPAFIVQLMMRESNPPTPSARFSGLGKESLTLAKFRHTDPAALRRELKGDLDWIVMRAIDKDRTRRYETANGLARDIERYLRNEPVEARPPSAAYRLKKFVKRNRGMVVGGTVVAVAIVTGFVMATLGMVRATRAEAATAREAAVSQQVTDFLIDLFEVSDPGEALGNSITARELLDRGANRITEELNEQPVVQARLMETMGTVYRQLGLYDAAQPLLERSLQLQEATLGSTHPDVAPSLDAVADLYRDRGMFARAEPLYRRALTIKEGSGSVDTAFAHAVRSLAGLYLSQARYEEAEPLLRRALALYEQILGPDHDRVATVLSNLGVLHYNRGEYDEAQVAYEKALAIRRELYGPGHPRLASLSINLGALYWTQRRFTEAETMYERAREIYERTLPSDHPRLAGVLNNLAETKWAQGRYLAAEPLFARALEIKQRILEPDHPSIAVSLNGLGNLRRDQGRYGEAEDLYRRALDIRERALGPDAALVAETLEDYATMLRKVNRASEAEGLEKRAATIRANLSA